MFKQQIASSLATLLVFFVLLFAYTKLAGPIPFSVNSISTTKTDSFSVTGEGKAQAVPNLAKITVGISANGQTVRSVQDQINTTINAVSSGIKNLGIDSKDIQTSNYNVNPNYDYTLGTQKITGYSANTNLTVTVRDITKVNAVVDSATGSGANQVGSPQFDVSDKTVALNEARRQAVSDAKQKASDAAGIAGFSLGKIVNYSETLGGVPTPITLAAPGLGGANVKSTDIQTGSNEIDITVTLTYEVK